MTTRRCHVQLLVPYFSPGRRRGLLRFMSSMYDMTGLTWISYGGPHTWKTDWGFKE